MSRSWKIVLGAIASGTAIAVTAQAASLPSSGSYNFTGTVLSATPSCPHEAHTHVAGYALFPGISGGDVVENVPPGFKYGFVTRGNFAIAFSDGPDVKKIGYGLKTNDTFKAPFTSAEGTMGVGYPTPPRTIGGQWAGSFDYKTSSTFDFTVRLKFPTSNIATCTIEYSLDFVKGIPSKFLDLL